MTADSSMFDVVCHHEAGHAVAAVLRGGHAALRLVTVDASGEGYTGHRSRYDDRGFIAYAGMWAEARYTWGDRALDDEDEWGCTFDDAVGGVMVHQPYDAQVYCDYEADNTAMLLASGMSKQEATRLEITRASNWCRELERLWPVITAVAEQLSSGTDVSGNGIETLLTAA